MSVKISLSFPYTVSHEAGLTLPPLEADTYGTPSTVTISDVTGLVSALNGKLNDTMAQVGNIVTVTGSELNMLAGTQTYGLVQADFFKLADITVSATEINELSGITGNVQSLLNGKVSKAGDVMSGSLDMASYPFYLDTGGYYIMEDNTSGKLVFGNASMTSVTIDASLLDTGGRRIVNVVDPVDPQDAATKNYVDNAIAVTGGYLPITGGTMTGDIELNTSTLWTTIAGGEGIVTSTTGFVDVLITGQPEYRLSASLLDLDPSGTGTKTIASVSDPVNPQDAATKNYVDSTFMPFTGGNFTGNVGMIGNRLEMDVDGNSYIHSPLDNTIEFVVGGTTIMTVDPTTIDAGTHLVSNVVDPVSPQDAATKNYVDANFMPFGGGAFTGNLDMGGNTIFNVAAPVAGNQVGDRNYNDGRYLRIVNDLSDLANVGNAIVNLGLNPGGANDIWIKRSGDTMTGNLVMGTGSLVSLDDSGINFVSDTNSGISRTGIDEITLTTNGAARMVFRDGSASGVSSVIVPTNDALSVPSGSTAQRPFAPVGGEIRYNTDTSKFEIYEGGTWKGITSPPTIPASTVTFTPSGNVSSTDVQAAITELDTEKLPVSGGTMTGNLDLGLNQILNVAPDFIVADNRMTISGLQSVLSGNSYHISSSNTPSDAAPVYSFNAAQDTGIWFNGTDLRVSVGGVGKLSLGANINAEGNVIENVADPVNAQDAVTKNYLDQYQMERVLGRLNGVSLTTAPTTQIVYTVPTGKSHIVTKIIMVATSLIPGASPAYGQVELGLLAGNTNDIVDTSLADWGVTGAADQAVFLYPKQGCSTPNSGSNVTFTVAVAAGGTITSLVVDVIVMGIEI